MRFLAASFLWCLLGLPALVTAEGWKEVKSDHFIVYFAQDEKFASEVLDKAEEYYKDIASEIGYPRYSDFWTWDKRVKIYIYPDHASFILATSQPDWSQGMADYAHKQILSYAWSQGFLESLLPHEMAHLIFRDFVGFKGEIPLWLDEGVAQWAEKPKRVHLKGMAQYLYTHDQVISLEDMMGLDIRTVKGNDKIHIRATKTRDGGQATLFLSGENLVSFYYIQAFSLVGFLIEQYGSDSFAIFCRQLRDGKSLMEALRFAYPTHIRSIEDLEDYWREYLRGQG